MDDYVAMGRCNFCGEDNGSVLLHKQLKPIKPEEAFSGPCSACEERFKTMVYFIGDCGHSGFVKQHVVEEAVKPKDLVDAILKRRITRMEKCFACIHGMKVEDLEHIGRA